MRVLLVAAMLLFPFAIPGQTGKNQSQSKNLKTQSKRNPDNQPKNPTSLQQISAPQREPETPATEKKQEPPKPELKPWLTHGEWVMAILTFIYVVFTGGYVRIALLTLKAINRQADFTEKQAESNAQQFERQLKAIQDQLAIMERQLSLAARQWVDIKGWTAVQKTGKSGIKELTIGLDIFNPTRLPLILEMIETKIKGLDLPFICEQQVSIRPDSSHRVWINFDLTEDMNTELIAINGLTLRMQMVVWFRDELKRRDERHFSGILLYTNVAGQESADFLPEGNMIPRPADQNSGETTN